MIVAEYIADFFIERGIRHVFGYQGGAIMKVIDVLVATGKISYLQNYHEQASAFAADGYGRVSQHVGVAMATSGPGATNLITGIANAHLDSVPTLFITGQDHSSHVLKKRAEARLNGFQDLDIVSIVKPITKYATAIYDASEIRWELEKAYALATTGRPGAVLLDIPLDIQFQEIEPAKLRSFTAETKPIANDEEVKNVLELLKTADRPLILAGGGIQLSKAEENLREFVQATGIPVVTTLNGVDALAGAHSFAGLHGNVFANIAVKNCDVLLVLGARLGQQQVGKNPQGYTSAKLIHVDVDAVEFGRAMAAEIAVKSDLKQFLVKLNNLVTNDLKVGSKSWSRQVDEWAQKYESAQHVNADGIDPVRAMKKMAKFFPENAVLTSDVGQNQMWVAQMFRKKGNQRLLNSSGLGSMGYSLPAAIGASYARPGAPIIAFMGDGGFQMNMQELMFIAQKQLPIKCVILNNRTLGMMRMHQNKYYGGRFVGATPEEFDCVDLEKIAAAYSIPYIRLNNEDEIRQLAGALNDSKPYLIEMRLSINSKLTNRFDEAEVIDQERYGQ